jgi:hypothetical protein
MYKVPAFTAPVSARRFFLCPHVSSSVEGFVPYNNLVMPGTSSAEAHVVRIIAPYVRYDLATETVVMLPAALARGDRERILLYLVALLGWRSVKPDSAPAAGARPGELAAALQLGDDQLRRLLDELSAERLIRARDGRYEADAGQLPVIEQLLAARSAPFEGDPRMAESAARRDGGPPGNPTPMMRIRNLIREGWFAQPRSANDVLAELRRRGAAYRPTDLTRQLLILSRSGELRRAKGYPPGGTREVWIYLQG